MTRDEAISKLKSVVASHPEVYIPERSIELSLDGYVALGILKLDVPKSAQQKFESGMRRVGYYPDSIAMTDIRTVLEAAGLRIVEK